MITAEAVELLKTVAVSTAIPERTFTNGGGFICGSNLAGIVPAGFRCRGSMFVKNL
jgi:hypothetical protein